MAVITDLRDGIAANLEAVTVHDLAVLKHVPTEVSASPAAIVEFDGAAELRQTMGKGVLEYSWVVRLVVWDNGDAGDAEQILDELLTSGTGGVWAALESDRTLDGAAQDMVVDGYGPYENITIDGSQTRAVMGSVNLRVYAGGA